MTEVIKAFMTALPATNKYYEEATETADFPLVIVSGLATNDLEYGQQLTLDVDFWTNEGSGNAAALEALCDTVRLALDRKLISKPGSFAGAIYFDNQQVIIDGEQDLIRRRQTYIVRAFLI